MTTDELEKEAEEKLEQEVLDWVDNEFRDKVTAKRCQTFFTYSELVRSIFDFAESREERIAELEKDFLQACKVREQVCKEAEQACERKDKRIAELEKENAELKTDYKVLSCSVGDFGELQDKFEEEQRKNNGLSDNLVKAKELLKEWIIYHGGTKEFHSALQDKTEAFLKECE